MPFQTIIDGGARAASDPRPATRPEDAVQQKLSYSLASSEQRLHALGGDFDVRRQEQALMVTCNVERGKVQKQVQRGASSAANVQSEPDLLVKMEWRAVWDEFRNWALTTA